LTVVSAADRAYARCLHQMLCSAERRHLPKDHGFTVYDLGLGAQRAGLEQRFPWCTFRSFDFASHPAHIAQPLRRNGWKPLVIADAMHRDGGLLLWVDSATVFKSGLDAVTAEIAKAGVYSLCGQAQLGARCERSILDLLQVPLETRSRAERVSGVLGIDSAHEAARQAVDRWQALALDERYLGTRSATHMSEQALLGIVLYELETQGLVRLGSAQIDISSAAPVRWMSSRNKVPAWLPRWLDPLARAYYASAKAIDRAGIRLAHRLGPPFNGLQRWAKEHFSVCVGCMTTGSLTAVRAPRLKYYADPFLWSHQGRACLFVEEFDYLAHRARLCALPLDEHGVPHGRAQPLDVGGRHVSFPFLFEHGGRLYLVPETCADRTVDLYECEAFPDRWRRVRRMFYGIDAADTVVFPHAAKWWLMTSVRAHSGTLSRHLEIHYADDPLSGEWRAHPVNSRRLYADRPRGTGRNAGAPLRHESLLLRPMQQNTHYYGETLRWMKIALLDERHFREEPYEGTHPLARLAADVSPHHVSSHGTLVAWDVRDRVGYSSALRPKASPAHGSVLQRLRWSG
jgi:hypothetical protein